MIAVYVTRENVFSRTFIKWISNITFFLSDQTSDMILCRKIWWWQTNVTSSTFPKLNYGFLCLYNKVYLNIKSYNTEKSMQKYFNFNSSVKNNLIFCYVMNFRHSIWWIRGWRRWFEVGWTSELTSVIHELSC